MNTVLIADHDLGFVFWLGKTLGEAGYQCLPAKSVSDAAQLAARFEINVLVVNPALAGVEDFVRSLRLSQGQLEVIALNGVEPLEIEDLYASEQKPSTIDELATIRWLTLVQLALAQSAGSRTAETRFPAGRHGGGSFF